jgi:hypothetical protein
VDVRGVGCYSPHSVVNICHIYIYILLSAFHIHRAPRPNRHAMCHPVRVNTTPTRAHQPSRPPLPPLTDSSRIHFPVSLARGGPCLPGPCSRPLTSTVNPMAVTHPYSAALRVQCSPASVAYPVRSSSTAEEEQGQSIFLPSPVRRLKPMVDTEIQPATDGSSPCRLLPAPRVPLPT